LQKTKRRDKKISWFIDIKWDHYPIVYLNKNDFDTKKVAAENETEYTNRGKKWLF